MNLHFVVVDTLSMKPIKSHYMDHSIHTVLQVCVASYSNLCMHACSYIVIAIYIQCVTKFYKMDPYILASYITISYKYSY